MARSSLHGSAPSVRGADDEARRVLGLVHESRQAMLDLHESWLYDVQFFRGFQWIYQNSSVGRIMPIPVTPWRPRITYNQVRPLVMQMLALLIEKDPTWEAVGAGTDEDDLRAAAGYEALLRRDWDRMDLGERLKSSLLDMFVTGNGFWRVVWNPDGGRAIGVPGRDGESLSLGTRRDATAMAREAERRQDAEGADVLPFSLPGEEPEPGATFEGSVDVQSTSPFNIDVPVSATSMDSLPWLAHHAWVHRDVLIDRIGSKARDIRPGAGMDEANNYERLLRFDQGAGDVDLEGRSEQVRVTEFWETPTKRHPEGRVITVAGGATLAVRNNPYGGRLPFVHFGCNPSPSRFWHDGIVRELEPLQKAVNSALSRYAMIMMLSSNPKWVADYDSGISDDAINDEPGEVIKKRRGTRVEAVPPPPTPTIHPAIMTAMANGMQFLTGVNDALAGQNPPNVRAALSIRFLQESGLRRFVPIARGVEAALRRAARLALHMHRRFWSDDRVEAALGEAAVGDMHHMRRADLDRVADVTVRSGSMTPKSPAAQQELVISMLQYAPFLFEGPGGVSKEEILRALDMPQASGRTGLKAAQRNRAYREHVDVLEGRPVEVLPWDDDDLHLDVHDARLSDDAWSRDNAEAAAELAAHRAEHEHARQTKIMQALGGVPAPGMQPAPPGPGAGGGDKAPGGAAPGPTAPAGPPGTGPPA